MSRPKVSEECARQSIKESLELMTRVKLERHIKELTDKLRALYQQDTKDMEKYWVLPKTGE